jgi:pyruvate formate lyase activating enzyme
MFRRLEDRCRGCGNCRELKCSENCTGCRACLLVCPEDAILPGEPEPKEYTVAVNGREVRARGTVGDALEGAGLRRTMIPGEGDVFSPCGSGACLACSVSIDGCIAPSCVTPLSEGMVIETAPEPPLRYVSSFGPHTAGGVGTPFSEKTGAPVEVVCFTHGCNLRCPQCQNSQVAFTSQGNLLDPHETAGILMGLESIYRTGTVTISGGECTLNRTWLSTTIRAIRELKGDVNIHVDTNGTILTPEYLDELRDSGMNRIGIDIKGLRPETFMEISGLHDEKTARVYLDNSWNAFRYLSENHRDIFMGLGVPYSRSLISIDELSAMASRISSINRDVQVTVLDYRPEFRRRDIERPSEDEMMRVKDVMIDEGLRNVVVQTSAGFR